MSAVAYTVNRDGHLVFDERTNSLTDIAAAVEEKFPGALRGSIYFPKPDYRSGRPYEFLVAQSEDPSFRERHGECVPVEVKITLAQVFLLVGRFRDRSPEDFKLVWNNNVVSLKLR